MRDGTPTNKERPFQTRKNLSKQGKTFPNKERPFQTRKDLSKQGKTFPNKEKHQQTRETPPNKKNTFQARSCLSSKGYLPIKCRGLQVVGVFGQGKAVVSDGRYGVIGG